jgi:DNA-binding MarR family transcriptional regulator
MDNNVLEAGFMGKTKITPLTSEDQIHLLRRFFNALQVIHKHEPRITEAGIRLLLFVALETKDRSSLLIPRLRDVTRQLDLSPSGASRLLETLTAEGRRGRPPDEGGLGLIETDRHIAGRRTNGFVLSEKGRKCVEEVLTALSGKPSGRFECHNADSLFKLLIAEWPQQPSNKGRA